MSMNKSMTDTKTFPFGAGKQALQSGDLAAAEATLAQAVQQTPGSAEAAFLRAAGLPVMVGVLRAAMAAPRRAACLFC
jgi:thioredoxin-like negative regulator of GroEL